MDQQLNGGELRERVTLCKAWLTVRRPQGRALGQRLSRNRLLVAFLSLLLFPALAFAQAELRSGSKGTKPAVPVTATSVDVNTNAVDVNCVSGCTGGGGGGLTDTQLRATAVPVSQSGTWSLVNISGVISLPTNAAQEHITAGSPHAVRLSDGSAFYDAVKTGQLPASLVGGRLDANLGAWLGSTAPTVGQKTSANSIPVTISSDQTAYPVTANAGTNLNTSTLALEAGGNLATIATKDTSIDSKTFAGGVSAANSSSTPLAGGAAFTGTYEDITNYAAISISVLADQPSANAGLSFQWSHDGSNTDLATSTSVQANSGRGFSIAPRARFFRVSYTNGVAAQGTFRLGVVYHTGGSGVITRPLDQLLETNNYAETVRAVPAVQDTNPVSGAAASYSNALAGQGPSGNGVQRVTIAWDQRSLFVTPIPPLGSRVTQGSGALTGRFTR